MADPSLDDRHEAQRAPRKNLFLAATIDGGGGPMAVRVRNLSESGAMLEGAALPQPQTRISMRRGELQVDATVMWVEGERCGIRFDQGVAVDDWVAGKRTNPRHQARVDMMQAAIRANQAAAAPAPVKAPAGGLQDLDRRVADEIAHVRGLLEQVGDALVEEPVIVERHVATLQRFELAWQILGHLSTVLAAEDRTAAVDAIGLDELRARLLRG